MSAVLLTSFGAMMISLSEYNALSHTGDHIVEESSTIMGIIPKMIGNVDVPVALSKQERNYIILQSSV